MTPLIRPCDRLSLQRRRSGAVLVFTLLLLVVLDCILVGTLQLARQQRRIADNRVELLELQLRAEGALRRSLSEWPHEILGSGADSAVDRIRANVRQTFERVAPDLVLMGATATHPSLRSRYSTSLLVAPPALTGEEDLADAAIAAATVTLYESSIVSSGPPDTCGSAAPALRAAGSIEVLAGARLQGSAAAPGDELLPGFDRIAARAADGQSHLVLAQGDTVLDGSFTGILIAAGTVTLADGAALRGLVLARGGLEILSGASLTGAARAGGHAAVRGHVTRAACEVAAAVRNAALRTARPAHGRVWIPAF